MDDYDPGETEPARPPVVGPGDVERIGRALASGAVIGVPGVGGYALAVRAGTAEAETRLEELVADPDGPHYAVGHREAVPALTSGWTEEVEQLLERCWPGPLDVFLPRSAAHASAPSSGAAPVGGEDRAGVAGPPDEASHDTAGAGGGEGAGEGAGAGADAEAEAADIDAHGGWAVTVGMPDGRALRRLCREHGPWRTVPLSFTEASQVAHAFDAVDVALVIDGGTRDGPTATLVDATVSPVNVLREGALPSSFVEGAMLVGHRKRWFSRSGRAERPERG